MGNEPFHVRDVVCLHQGTRVNVLVNRKSSYRLSCQSRSMRARTFAIFSPLLINWLCGGHRIPIAATSASTRPWDWHKMLPIGPVAPWRYTRS